MLPFSLKIGGRGAAPTPLKDEYHFVSAYDLQLSAHYNSVL